VYRPPHRLLVVDCMDSRASCLANALYFHDRVFEVSDATVDCFLVYVSAMRVCRAGIVASTCRCCPTYVLDSVLSTVCCFSVSRV